MNHVSIMHKRLMSKSLDVTFMHALLPVEGLQTHRIFYEPLKVVLPKNHPLVNRHAISLPELRDDNFIMFPRQIAPAMYDLFLFECADKAKFQPNIIMEADPQLTRIELVANNMGVTFASAGMEKMCGDGVIFKNIVSTDLIHFPMDLAWNPQNTASHLQAFIEFTKSFIITREFIQQKQFVS